MKNTTNKTKSKLRRFSRSSLAVCLALLIMLGTITTFFAVVVEDSVTGASSDVAETGWNSSTDRLHIRIGSTWYDKYFSSSGVTTFTVDNDNTTIEFELNFNGTVYKLHSSQNGFSASGIHSTDGETRLAKDSGTSTYTVEGVYADTYTVELKSTVNNGEVQFKISGNYEKDTTDKAGLYLYGKQFGGWSFDTSTDTWDTQITKLTEKSEGLYYVAHTVVGTSTDTDGDRFRIMSYDGDSTYTHYVPTTQTSNIYQLTKGTKADIQTMGSGQGDWCFGLDGNMADDSVVIWVDLNNKKVWASDPKSDIATSLTLTADKYVLTETNETVTFTATADTPLDNNLTYTLYEEGSATALQTKTVTDGGAAVFDALAPNVQRKNYYATVQKTSDESTYNAVTSDTVTITNNNEEYKPTYTVTFSSNNPEYGTVTAKKENGDTLSSGDSVKEGTTVIITATPKTGCKFKDWTGSESETSTLTVSVYENVGVTGNFTLYGFKVYDGVSYYNMRELPNGTWISLDSFTQVADNSGWLTVERLEDSKYVHAGADNDTYWITNSNKIDVSSKWSSTVPDTSTQFYTNHVYDPGYLVYDPENDELWISETDADNPSVVVTAKDGTIRSQDGATHTSDFGDTTVTLLSPSTITGTVEADAYDDKAVIYNLSAKDVNAGVKLKIETQVNSTYLAKGYYVKGFVVTGYEKSFSLLWQEFDSEGNELASYDDKAYIDAGYNTFELEISGYPTQAIEITPIYYIKEETSGDNVRFYVDGFAGDVYDNWGGTLAIDVYGTDGTNSVRPWGEYPGQPMINYNGRYMVDIPRDNIQGITLNNYVWDHVHSNLYYGTGDLTDNQIPAAIEPHNYQTYDYNDFKYINDKLTSLGKDEDIIFSFRYKRDSDHNTKATSNLGVATYYVDTPSTDTTENDYRNGYNTITDTHEAMYDFEPLTDFYNNRVDVFGDLVDVEGNETKAAYNPLRIVSNGYDYNIAGRYATAWALYSPASWTGTPGTYTLADVVGGQGINPATHQSESFFIDPDSEARVRFKYDASIRDNTTIYSGDDAQDNETILAHWQRKFREQNNGSTDYPSLIVDLADIPVEITYEYEVQDGYSNLNVEDGAKNLGYRSDGRWYYSSSDQLVQAHVLIEYSDKENGTYVRDYFQGSSIDYQQSGYDPSVHTGLSTGIQAYFTNDGEETREGKTFSNTSGYTEANGITDGDYTFDLVTQADSSGNYLFKGWYLYTDGTYTHVSDDPSYQAEATANDVYVARYYKVPSGTLNISHVLDAASTGTGKCYVKAEIRNSDNTSTIYTYPEVESGSILISNTYIKSTSNNQVLITLRTVPDNFSEFVEYLEYVTAEIGTKLENSSGGAIEAKAYVDITTGTTEVTATIRFLIKDLFDSTSGEQTIKSMPFTSNLTLPSYKYSIKYTYPAYNESFGNQSYTVTGDFTEDELDTFMDIDNSHILTMKNDSNLRNTFISNHAPYEDNFMQTISFDSSGFSAQNYTKLSYTYSLEVQCQNAVKDYVYPTFSFPYDVNGSYVAKEKDSSGRIEAITNENTKLSGRRVFEWVVTSGATTQSQLDSDPTNTPVFIKAPLIIYSDVTNDSTAQYFKYWIVETTENYENLKMDDREYTRCYDYEFNLSIFQDCTITPVYGPDSFENRGMVNPPSKYNEYSRFDPEIQQKDDEDNGVTITFIENSRNQYNCGDYGDADTAASAMSDNRKGAGDRIYSDFLLSFNNVADGKILRDECKDMKAGLIVEMVDDLESDGAGGYVIDTEANYQATYGATLTEIESKVSGKRSSLENLINSTSTTKIGNIAKSEFTAEELDNKNRIQYYYSMANRRHKSYDDSDQTMEEGVYLSNNHKLYRAYAYITDGTNITISEKPVYFTIYDIGTIAIGSTTSN